MVQTFLVCLVYIHTSPPDIDSAPFIIPQKNKIGTSVLVFYGWNYKCVTSVICYFKHMSDIPEWALTASLLVKRQILNFHVKEQIQKFRKACEN